MTNYKNKRQVKAKADPRLKYNKNDWIVMQTRILKTESESMLYKFKQLTGKEIAVYAITKNAIELYNKWLTKQIEKRKEKIPK